MSPPPVPSLPAAVAAVFRLQWRRLVRGKKLRLGIVSVVLVLSAVLAARWATPNAKPTDVVQMGILWGFFRLLAFLVPFLFTAGAIAEDVESRTFAYLAVRPVGRFALTAGKYMAGTAMAVALLVVGLVVLHVGAFLTTPTPMIDQLSHTARAAGALSLLAAFYGALCMFWGAAVPEAAGIVSALYLAAIEFAFAFLPSVFRFISMNYLAQQIAGLPKGGILPQSVPEVPVWAAIVAVAAMALVFLSLAALVVQLSEYRYGKA